MAKMDTHGPDYRIAVFGFDGCSAWAAAGILEIFAVANLARTMVSAPRKGTASFVTAVIASGGRTVTASHGIRFGVSPWRSRYDAVIVPPIWCRSLSELRRTGQIFLKPFGYRDAALFHPRASLVQRAMTYFICGGIPLYLRHFESGRSVLQNIEHVMLGEQAALYREPDFLLREELREVEKYYMILMALAGGALPSRDIARQAGIGDRSLHYYLDQLASLGYIDKHFPLTSQRPKARDVRYRLLDPFLRFWFYFIYPHTSLIAQVGAQRAVKQLIQPELEAYFGLCYESGRHLFVRSLKGGRKKRPENVRIHTLDELYA